LTERHLKLAAYLKIMSKFSIGRKALVFISAEENPPCPPHSSKGHVCKKDLQLVSF
jgi:hypothetical protein